MKYWILSFLKEFFYTTLNHLIKCHSKNSDKLTHLMMLCTTFTWHIEISFRLFSLSFLREPWWMFTITALEECCPFFGLWHVVAICPGETCQGKYKLLTLITGKSDCFCVHSIKASSNQTVSNPKWMCLLMTFLTEHCINEGLRVHDWFRSIHRQKHTQFCLAREHGIYSQHVFCAFRGLQGNEGWRREDCLFLMGGGFWTLL